MITYQALPKGVDADVVRFCVDSAPGAFPKFAVVCVAVWESRDTVLILGMLGKLDRALLVEFVRDLAQKGVRTIKAWRADGHRLPMARAMPGGHLEINVEQVVSRFA